MGLYPAPFLPAEVVAADHGFKTWSFDAQQGTAATIIPTAGLLHLVKMWNHSAAPMSISTGYVNCGTAGASLTNVGFGLYTPTGQALMGTASVNTAGATATAFQSTGLKAITFTAQVIAPGAGFYLGFWFTGTTMPTLARGSTSAAQANMNLATPNLRFATANASLTTAAPTTYSAQTIAAAAYWTAAS